MKKLSTLLIAICLLWAGNAFADGPACSVYLVGPGTYTQTLTSDFKFVAPYSMDHQGKCISFDNYGPTGPTNPNGCATIPWTVSNTAGACDQNADLWPFELVAYTGYMSNMDGTGNLIQVSDVTCLLAEQAQRAEDAANGLGTIEFSDWPAWTAATPGNSAYCMDRYTAKIIKTEATMKFHFSVYNGYVGSAPSDYNGCNVDTTASPTGTAPPYAVPWQMSADAIITHKDPAQTGVVAMTDTDVTVRMLIDGVQTNVFMGNSGPPLYQAEPSGLITRTRMEIDRPVQGDLNSDGIVSGLDFIIFKANWGASAACACSSPVMYWVNGNN